MGQALFPYNRGTTCPSISSLFAFTGGVDGAGVREWIQQILERSPWNQSSAKFSFPSFGGFPAVLCTCLCVLSTAEYMSLLPAFLST